MARRFLARFARREANRATPETASDAVIRRWLAAMPPPEVPPGLADRIIRDVPRLAQSSRPGRFGDLRDRRNDAPAVLPGADCWPRPATPPGAHQSDQQQMFGWHRLAGLAAAVAVVVSVLPQIERPTHEVRLPKTARPHADAMPDKIMQAPVIPAVRVPVRVAIRAGAHPAPVGPHQREDQVGIPALALPDASPPPALPAAPPPAAVAVAGPVAGPTDLPASVPVQLGSHGVMGPVLPQGLGMTGGAAHGGDFGMTPAGPPPGGGVPH